MAIDRLLCVGGPRDGYVLEVDRGSEFHFVVDCANVPIAAYSEEAMRVQSFEMHQTVYTRLPVRFGILRKEVLVPYGQTPEQTLGLLLNGYRPC